MKKNLVLFISIMTLITQWSFAQDLTLNTAKASRELNVKTIIWLNPEIDLGSVEFNKPITATFNLKNNSEEAVIIKNVKTSCGCTAANYSNTVIKPGETSKIEVTYNAKTKGYFSKTISVSTSLKEDLDILTLKGTVN